MGPVSAKQVFMVAYVTNPADMATGGLDVKRSVVVSQDIDVTTSQVGAVLPNAPMGRNVNMVRDIVMNPKDTRKNVFISLLDAKKFVLFIPSQLLLYSKSIFQVLDFKNQSFTF